MHARFLVACLMALVVPAHAAAPEPVNLPLTAAITVDPDGRVQSLQWQTDRRRQKMQQVIAERVEPAVRQWKFEPGRIDGVPAATSTFLTLRFKGLPGPDGALKLEFVSASTGARIRKVQPPSFPLPTRLRIGEMALLVATVDFDTKGKGSLRAFDYYGPPALEEGFGRSTREAVQDWRVEPETVGGHPVASSMRFPVKFCLSSCSPPLDAEGRPIEMEQATALRSAVRLLDVRDPLVGG